jgi:hypothetical protein
MDITKSYLSKYVVPHPGEESRVLLGVIKPSGDGGPMLLEVLAC